MNNNNVQGGIPFINIDTGMPNPHWLDAMVRHRQISHEAAINLCQVEMLALMGKISAYLGGSLQRQNASRRGMFDGQFMGAQPETYQNLMGGEVPHPHIQRINQVLGYAQELNGLTYVSRRLAISNELPFPHVRPFLPERTKSWDSILESFDQVPIFTSTIMLHILKHLESNYIYMPSTNVPMSTSKGELSMAGVFTTHAINLKQHGVHWPFVVSHLQAYNTWVNATIPPKISIVDGEPSMVTEQLGECHSEWVKWLRQGLASHKTITDEMIFDHFKALTHPNAIYSFTGDDSELTEPHYLVGENISMAWVAHYAKNNNLTLNEAYAEGLIRQEEDKKV